MLGGLGAFEEDVAVHPHGQAAVVVLAQIAAPHEQVVVVAVVAARVVVQSGNLGGMRLVERGLAAVVRD